jgi:hypothetical protein
MGTVDDVENQALEYQRRRVPSDIAASWVQVIAYEVSLQYFAAYR